MKKSILIIAILFCQNAFCQSYTFDRFIQYKNSNGSITVLMINSKDTSYHFYAASFDKEIIGNIFDLKTKIRHSYSVANLKDTIKFEYLNSSVESKKQVPCYDKYNLFEVIQTPLDSLTTNFAIVKYKNTKKKRIIGSSNITAVTFDIPLFSLRMEPFLGHFIFCQKIDFPENYIPTIVEIDYFNGIKTKSELIQNKEINLLLILNKTDIKLKDY